ncbi:MAG: TIGR00266 family protein [Armatimonadota bacterium]|nr:TIGR00266 family protein [Armatimonadota bacterium]MCX7778472.1 TIGR00266 family protein [Armatimonadota bacterium]MDW8026051.1 TIGR00266 family protein [Armatimonadota bacterium]
MRWEVSNRPSYSLLKISLEPGEALVAEPGAMVLYRGAVLIDTGARGGIAAALLRSMFGGESLFLNTFRAEGESEVWLAPNLPGDIHYLPLDGNGYIIQQGSYLAHHGDAEIGIAWRGFRGLLTEGELIWLRVRGYGGVWVTAFGGIEQVNINAGEKVIVDNFHFVAMDEDTTHYIRTFGGIKSFLLGGEGIVVEVQGPTNLWLQTRHIASLANELLPILRRHLRRSS